MRILFTKMLHGQDDNIEDSIRMLSKLLYKHYYGSESKLFLIDEYDVPLDKAFSEWLLQGDGFSIRGFSAGAQDQ